LKINKEKRVWVVENIEDKHETLTANYESAGVHVRVSHR